IGWISWKKHMDAEKNVVCKRRMTLKQDALLLTASALGVFGYAYFLNLLGGNLPIADSMSTVFSVIAQVLMIKRFVEQWIIWIIVDAVSVIMWIAALFTEGASVAVLLMWCVFLANAIIMFMGWYKDTEKQIEHS
ncbi:MAG: nicotinamide riboside transporter PnuC, partial [Lachnospiraceae bacterium]|nr:nicotinamide riboside transporter PnuC [Lachnospiraceae bacterium]